MEAICLEKTIGERKIWNQSIEQKENAWENDLKYLVEEQNP